MTEARFDVDHTAVSLDQEAAGPRGLDQIEMQVQSNPGQSFKPLRKVASGGELSRIMLAVKSVLASADRISVLVFDEIDANIGGRLGSVIGRKLRDLANGVAPTAEPASGKSTGKTGSKQGKRSTKRKKSSAKKQTKQANQATAKTAPAGTGYDEGEQHQVLCITHLPQIAAFADRHFRIVKQVEQEGEAKTTRTTVTPLAQDHRIDELAEMMAGKQATQTTRQQAKELLEAAG
jgi:DNA repair protein RecN (Recombination protein N)